MFFSAHVKQVLTILRCSVPKCQTLDNAVSLARLESFESLKVDNIVSQKSFMFPDIHGVLTLSSGLQKTVELPQDQHMDGMVDVTHMLQYQVSISQTAQKTVEVSAVPVEVIEV